VFQGEVGSQEGHDECQGDHDREGDGGESEEEGEVGEERVLEGEYYPCDDPQGGAEERGSQHNGKGFVDVDAGN